MILNYSVELHLSTKNRQCFNFFLMKIYRGNWNNSYNCYPSLKKKKKKNIVGTVPKSNGNIIGTEAKTSLYTTQLHDRPGLE